MRTGTEEYYRRRALEYDRVYDKAERQADLLELRSWVSRLLAGRRVLEVAAGTGWWTDSYVDGAVEATVTDVNVTTLEVAATRRTWPPSVRFLEADASDLESIPGRFDAAFVGFFWSHVPLHQLDEFLDGLVQRLDHLARVVIIDNRYVQGSSYPITRTDPAGDTYQERPLEDGTRWEVLKNFPTPVELRQRLERVGNEIEVNELDFYWTATFQVGA